MTLDILRYVTLRHLDPTWWLSDKGTGSVDPRRFERALEYLPSAQSVALPARYLACECLRAWRLGMPPGEAHWARALQRLADTLAREPANVRNPNGSLPHWAHIRARECKAFEAWLVYTLERERRWAELGYPDDAALRAERRHQVRRARRIARAQAELAATRDEWSRARIAYRLARMQKVYRPPPLPREDLALLRRRAEMACAGVRSGVR